jgi:hypothetical protein
MTHEQMQAMMEYINAKCAYQMRPTDDGLARLVAACDRLFELCPEGT